MSDTVPLPREVLERFQQTSIDKSIDEMLDLYAEDAVYEFPFTPPGMPSRLDGRGSARSWRRTGSRPRCAMRSTATSWCTRPPTRK